MVTPKRLSIHLLGETRIVGDGVVRRLPPSRKTRGLLAYLALSTRPVSRDSLCRLIWSSPDDPRGALRWSLSRLRALLADDSGPAIDAAHDGIALDRDRVSVDLLDVRATVDDSKTVPSEELHAALTMLEAGYLGGLDDVAGPEFQLWLESERDAARKLHARALEALVERHASTPDLALPLSRKRVALDPLCTEANVELLRLTLETMGRNQAQELLARQRRVYGNEDISDAPLRAAWASLTAGRRESEPHRGHVSLGDVPAAGEETIEPPPLPDRPSVAVLGFDDVGDDNAPTALATGLAVDLTSRLSQLPHLFVIARASAVRFAAKDLGLREIGRRLGVRYLVDGTAQRDTRRVRVTVSLLDALTETEIWSDRYDRPLDDLFSMQDEITGSIVAGIEPQIERAEMARSFLVSPENLTAWEYFHQGLWHCFRFTGQDNETAYRLFRKALEMDPRFSRAHAGLSFTHYSRAFLGTVPDVGREIAESLELARKSVDLEGRDSMGHWCLGRALFLSHQHDEALAAIDRSLDANPNYAVGHYAKAFIGVHAGLDRDAIPELERAERLSPFDPLRFAMKGARAISLANQGRDEEAAIAAIRATQEPNAHFHIHAIAAACLELARRSEEARSSARRVLEARPGYTVEAFQRSFPHRDEPSRERTLSALARAGIPRTSRS